MYTDVRIDWYRTPIEKERLRELTTRSDFRGLMKMLSHLLLVSATGALSYWAWVQGYWLVLIPVVWVHGTIFAYLSPGAATHELSHGTPFKTRGLNEFFYRLVCFMSWINPLHYRTGHMSHHQYTAYAELDAEAPLPVRLPKWWQWIFLYTINIPGAFNLIRDNVRLARGRLKGKWEPLLYPESDPDKRRELRFWSRLNLIGHAVLAVVFIVTGQWILLFLATFATFIGGWLPILTGMAQHAGLSPNTPDFRMSTRTMRLNPVFRYLYWNMNYHLEHHMYAGVPFFNLPRLHKLIRHDTPAPCRSLAAAWRDMIEFCNRQKTDLSFAHRPDLPATAAPARLADS